MIFILKAVLLWISILGYCFYLKKYMNSAFTPIFTLSSIGTVIFLAGLLNIMPISVYIITLGGWICLVLSKPFKKDFFCEHKGTFIVFGLFSVICGLFLVRLYNQIPTHYDCFSHWLTVIREMIKTDSMPNFNSTLIAFQGYPTGTAGFVYYICEFLGSSRDDMVLFAQSILYAGSVVVFFAFVKRKDILGVLIATVGSLFCIVANARNSAAIDSLLVDTLVSLISIAVVAVIIYYRQNLLTGVLVSLPMQMFLVAIKNSGILMVAINFVLVMALAIAADYSAKRKMSILNLIKLGSLTAGIPAVLYYLWIRHVDYVFAQGAVSKHTASVENYKQMLGSKTGEQIKEILSVFSERFFSWNNTWLLLIIVTVVLLVGWLMKKYILKTKSKTEIFIFVGLIGSYFAFMVVLAAMYILSMPYKESIVLAAYERYENTILIYIIGCVTIYCLTLVGWFTELKKGSVVKIVVLLMISSTLMLRTAHFKNLFIKPNMYEGSSRFYYEQIKSEYSVKEGKSYFIYSNQHRDDGGYHSYLAKYIFWSKDIFLCLPEQFADKKDKIAQYDYLIIIDEDEQISDFLSDYSQVPDKQVYSVKEMF